MLKALTIRKAREPAGRNAAAVPDDGLPGSESDPELLLKLRVPGENAGFVASGRAEPTAPIAAADMIADIIMTSINEPKDAPSASANEPTVDREKCAERTHL